jgi:hypothetical protein
MKPVSIDIAAELTRLEALFDGTSTTLTVSMHIRVNGAVMLDAYRSRTSQAALMARAGPIHGVVD